MQIPQVTQYPELNELLASHAKEMQNALTHNFVGYYLQGSFAVGDADHTSDVDFVVATNKELSGGELISVQHIHTKMHDRSRKWARRMEYSFFPSGKLSQFSSPYVGKERNHTKDRDLWFFDHGQDTIVKSDHCNTLVVRWIVREKGKAILGQDPKNLIPVIPRSVLRTEIRDTIIGKAANTIHDPSAYNNRYFQSYLVLNYTRMLHNLYVGRIDSKLQGVLWAKTNIDPVWHSLIDFCWKDRQDSDISVKHPSNPTVFREALEYVRYVSALAEKYQIEK